jgi:peptidoglycan/LPS O-acetylase OafA/YrhL
MLRDSHMGGTHRPDIEGLRGLAVLAIIAYDSKVPLIHGGFVGIDVFLVLSGYLICSLIWRQLQNGSFSLDAFYLGRLQRVMPSLLVVILFCLGMGSLVLSPWEMYRLGQGGVAASVSASNFLYLIRGSFFSQRAIIEPLLMTWSLGLAMQFWFVLPLLLIALRRRARSTVFVVLATVSGLSLLACVYGEFRQHVWNFYLPITRAWEFAAGSLLALGWEEREGTDVRRNHDWLGLSGGLMILGAMVFYHPEMRFPGYEAMLPVLGTTLILASPRSWVSRILGGGPLVAIGAISYPLYLWHWPLLSFAEICSARPLRAQTIAIVMALALAASLASYILVERWFMQPRNDAAMRGLVSYAAVIFIVASVSGSFYWSKGMPVRSPTLYGIESRAALYRHYPCISSGSYLRLSSQCSPRPSASEPAMAVLGGGHAEAFAEGLRDYLRTRGWLLITLTRESCPPTLGFSDWSAEDSTLADSCRQFNRSALDYVRSRPDVRAVVLVGRWRADYLPDTCRRNSAGQTADDNAANLRLGLAGEVAAFEKAGKHVIVLEDTPEFPYDPLAAVRARYLPFRRGLNSWLLAAQPEEGDGSSELRSIAVNDAEQKMNEQVLAVKAADPKLLLVDPKQVLCHGDRCSFASGSDIFFFDSIHLSRTGAIQILPLFPQLNVLR